MVVAGVQLGIVYLVIQLILVKITSPLIFAAVILFYQGTIVPLITFLIILFFCNLYVKQTFNLTTLLLSLLPLVAATCWFVLILVLS